MILLIDNYDSFTFNLAHYIEETGQSVSVIRNDKLTTKDIKNKIMHGKITEMTNENKSMIFKGLPNKFNATRYHSLVIDPKSLPECFNIISTTQDDNKTVIMGIEHKEYPIYGVQFHPESIGTSMLHGKKIISNFVNL